jgi:hypothetical protein
MAGHLGAQAFEQSPIEGVDPLSRIQLLPCHRQRERQGVLRPNAEIDLLTLPIIEMISRF